MNQNINYTIALLCLTVVSLAAIGGACYGPAAALTALIGLAGVGVGAIAGVVKQPKDEVQAGGPKP
jgi:hypothetical protein